MSSVTSFLVWILSTLLVPVITTNDGHDLGKFDRIQRRLCECNTENFEVVVGQDGTKMLTRSVKSHVNR